jgi:hypothetical protein
MLLANLYPFFGKNAGSRRKSKRFSGMLGLILSFFLLPIPQYATNQAFSGYTQVPHEAPIRIDACEASQEKNRGVVANSTVEYGSAFTILGAKTAKRVRIRYSFDDRTWQPLHTVETTQDGTFTPGSKISRTRRTGGAYHDRGVFKDVVAVVCSPIEIDYTDGSIWHDSSPLSVPSPAVTAPSSARPSASAVPITDPD